MINVFYEKEKQKVPIKNWCSDIEPKAVEQATNLSSLPFVFKHVSLMPDCHVGYGVPIGCVFASKDVIIPNAVGVDIGCGVCLLETPYTVEQITTDVIKRIMSGIRKEIPLGFKRHKKPQDEKFMPALEYTGIVQKEYDSATKQLGTLGGGNHFIEIQKDEEGKIYVMIHSGSRNLGKKVCDYYNDLAIKLNKRWFSGVPENFQLNFLPLDTPEAQEYIKDMNYCLEFAKSNRRLMIERIRDIFLREVPATSPFKIIDIHHNYATLENHFGENVWVHRKGATSARSGEIGLIPGSQGTSSYMVEGLGNEESFMSCSHGAGRKMGRKEAERSLDLEEEKKKMDEKGILHGIRHSSDLEEAPSAYKDIEEVINNQKDLIKVIKRLEPLAVIKG